MGGNALDNTYTERASSHHYLNVYAQVMSTFKEAYPNAVTHLPRGYRSKKTHGDLDILVRRDSHTKEFNPDTVRELFGVNEVHSNDGVYSFAVMNLQVDLVFKSRDYWRQSVAFLDCSDLGNLMGKVARWLGFKYGFQGLRYVMYTENRDVRLGTITLSSNPKKVFEFLGFDWNTFQKGFDTKHDLFEYVSGSEYFNKEAFMSKSLNASQRHRDSKRDMYQDFMKYINNVPDSYNTERMSKTDAVEYAESFFGVDVRGEHERRLETHRMHKNASSVFNGKDVMDEFGIIGSDLGKVMGKLKNEFDSKEQYSRYVLEHGKSHMLTKASQYINETTNTNKTK